VRCFFFGDAGFFFFLETSGPLFKWSRNHTDRNFNTRK
jgi:hypothetical protein